MSLSPLVYGQVVGRYVAIVGDTPADPDLEPDVVPMRGTVKISPLPPDMPKSLISRASSCDISTCAAPLPVAKPPRTTSSVTHAGRSLTGVREPTSIAPDDMPSNAR